METWSKTASCGLGSIARTLLFTAPHHGHTPLPAGYRGVVHQQHTMRASTAVHRLRPARRRDHDPIPTPASPVFKKRPFEEWVEYRLGKIEASYRGRIRLLLLGFG